MSRGSLRFLVIALLVIGALSVCGAATLFAGYEWGATEAGVTFLASTGGCFVFGGFLVAINITGLER